MNYNITLRCNLTIVTGTWSIYTIEFTEHLLQQNYKNLDDETQT